MESQTLAIDQSFLPNPPALMADPLTTEGSPEPTEGALGGVGTTRKEKRKALKKQKRKQIRREVAIKQREEDEARSNDPEEQLRTRLREEEEAAAMEREREAFEERERLWFEAAAAARRAQEEISAIAALKAEEDSERDKDNQLKQAKDLEDNDEWEYIEEGPAEIIWQGNEIIVKKKRVRVLKRTSDRETNKEDDDRPTSNPLPPQSAASTSHRDGQSAQEVFEDVAKQIPNFGTEQDKAHCPFHIKTGACRFGTRCSRVHFYPEKSCTLLIKNMYNGPGLAWEQDEGLESHQKIIIEVHSIGGSEVWPLDEDGHLNEEIEGCYEEFYEDVHTEFLKFGELINFKVCKNGSFHLRGNVYAHYKSFESAILAFNAINGRFFAGKQIMCEFVGVTRWKIAICGEYMKSRLRTCSRGTACNFIHCFRNPGGDYEWADWDSPPPKFWIKKMAVLFGPSVESVYDEHLNLEERERLRDSSWKSKSTSYRHQSRTSTCDEMDTTHGGDSERGDSDGNRDDHSTHSRRRKHSSKWRSTNRHESYEENRKSESRGHSLRHRSCSHDSTKDNPKEQDIYTLKQSRKREEKNGSEGHERHKEKHKTEDRFRSSSHLRHRDRHNSTDWVAADADDNRERSNCPSGGGHGIDGHDRYDGRHYSPDTGSVEDSRDNVSEQSNPLHRRHHGSHDRVGYGKKLKYTVHDPMPEKFSPDKSGDRWESTEIEEVDHHPLDNGSSRSRKRSRSDGRKGRDVIEERKNTSK